MVPEIIFLSQETHCCMALVIILICGVVHKERPWLAFQSGREEEKFHGEFMLLEDTSCGVVDFLHPTLETFRLSWAQSSTQLVPVGAWHLFPIDFHYPRGGQEIMIKKCSWVSHHDVQVPPPRNTVLLTQFSGSENGSAAEVKCFAQVTRAKKHAEGNTDLEWTAPRSALKQAGAVLWSHACPIYWLQLPLSSQSCLLFNSYLFYLRGGGDSGHT